VRVARVTSPVLLVATAVAAVVAAAAVPAEPAARAAAGAGELVLGAALGTVRVAVDDAGLAIGHGPWGRPARRIPRSGIAGARVWSCARSRTAAGGNRVRPGTTAVILRGGPALAVDLVGGRRVVVSVDDAATAAALLNAVPPGAAPPGV